MPVLKMQTKCDKQSRHNNKGEMKELYKQLNLTIDQQSAMKTLRESMREQRNAQRKNMQSQHGMSFMGQICKRFSSSGKEAKIKL